MEYYRTYGHEYCLVWWITATTATQFNHDMATLGKHLGVQIQADGDPNGAVSHTVAALDNLSGFLLLVDDAGCPDWRQLRHTDGRGHIIVTSTDSTVGYDSELWPVTSWNDTDTSLMLSAFHLPAPPVQVARLTDLCSGSPLLLAQSASYIRETGMDAAVFLDHMEERRAAVLSRGTAYPHSDYASTLAEVTSRIDTNALALLQILAVLSPAPVPIPPGDIQYPPPFEHHLEAEDAIGQLRRFALIQRDESTLLIHDLVREYIRSEIAPDVADARRAQAYYLIVSQIPYYADEVAARTTMAMLQPHLEVLTSWPRSPHGGWTDAIAASTLNKLGTYYQSIGLLSDGRKCLDHGLTLVAGAVDSEGVAARASLLHNLSEIEREADNLDGAVPLIRAALVLKSEHFGEGALSTGIAHASLGSALLNTEEFSEAEHHFKTALAIYRDSGELRWIIDGLNDLARLALDTGDHASAEEYLVEAISLGTSDELAGFRAQSHTLMMQLAWDIDDLLTAARHGGSARTAALLAGDTEILLPAMFYHARALCILWPPRGIGLLRRSVDLAMSVDQVPVSLGKTFQSIGMLCLQIGLLPEAELCIMRGHEVLSNLVIPDSDTYAISCAHVARLKAGKGAFADAIRLLEEEEARCTVPSARRVLTLALTAIKEDSRLVEDGFADWLAGEVQAHQWIDSCYEEETARLLP